MIKPLLAHIYEPSRWDLKRGCYIQRKYDGVRALYQNGRFQSRDGILWAPSVLQHIAIDLKETIPPEWVLDGELYVHGWHLGEINSAVAVKHLAPVPKTYHVQYYIFDLLFPNQSFSHRFSQVQNKDGELGPMAIVAPTQYVTTHQEADDFYIEAVNAGYEGIMYRLNDCPYTVPRQLVSTTSLKGNTTSSFLSDKSNRTFHLLKRKDWQDGEFTCVGVREGSGKRTGMVGNFIMEAPNGRPFDVGTGLTDQEWIYYLGNPPIGRQITVKFRCWTAAGIPFNPIVKVVH